MSIIKVEGISKKYQLGHIVTHKNLTNQFMRGWQRLMGHPSQDEVTEDFWALKDINFEVKQGDVLGIIGKNGAGKSTLLKILSRITDPTEGQVEINGRVSSLLEVGTGFNPELTGRENIFLNGSILGMTRREIQSKFDEIVAFSEVEKFLDTPVKRYSSGMYVRLAFAVAAHLEPEILVVDEVLAVGDLAFQKKCLGKLQDVGGEGRTVLFVSHNMSTLSALCTRAILLEKGVVAYSGSTQETVAQYLGASEEKASATADLQHIKQNRTGPSGFSKLLSITTTNENGTPSDVFAMGESIAIVIQFKLTRTIRNLEIGFCFMSSEETKLQTFIGHWEGLRSEYPAGIHAVKCVIPSINLFPGAYSITTWIKRQGDYIDDQVRRAIELSVIGGNITEMAQDIERYPNSGVFQRCLWQQVEPAC